jgi:hypothetical protein
MVILFSAYPEWVEVGSGQGRNDFETAGVAARCQGFQRSDNAGAGRKMPFRNRHLLWEVGRTGIFRLPGGHPADGHSGLLDHLLQAVGDVKGEIFRGGGDGFKIGQFV